MALSRILYLVTLLYLPSYTYEASLAILHMENDYKKADICAMYNPLYSALPRALQSRPIYLVVMASPQDGCKEHSSGVSLNSAAYFITSGGNCTFFEKLQLAYKSHAKQVILISQNDGKSNDFPSGTTEQHKNVRLAVGKVDAATWNDVVKLIGEPNYSQLYRPPAPPFDPNLALIWIIAVFTVVIGGFWAGVRRQASVFSNTFYGNEEDEEEEELPPLLLSPIIILVFIIMICIVLLLLYYFYNYLIYLVISIFAIATVQGSYDCISAITSPYNCPEWRLPVNNIPLLKSRPRVCNIIIFVFSLGLSICWVIIRNNEYGWILQDFLGVCLCITFLRHFYMPNLKISAILLIAMLLYDIFFVFITPFFSAQNKSVMISVASGEGNPEKIPMVIKIPKLVKTAMSLCERPYSLIGLGDILLPGVFVSFCHKFDVTAGTKHRVYFITSSIGYAYGLFMAFLVLVLMRSGQPALLYLSPSVLIAVTIVGAYRRELKELWTGEIDLDKRKNTPDESSQQSAQEDEYSKEEQKDDEECLITN